jgi:hypothetical protein
MTKLGHMIPLRKGKNPIYFGVIRSKVKVTYYEYNFWQQGRFSTITLVLYFGSLFIVSDLDLWPNYPKLNRVLPLPQGNHMAKFGKDPIYRTNVFARLETGRIMWLGMAAGGRPHRFPHNNFSSVYQIFTKLGHMIPLWRSKKTIGHKSDKVTYGY